MKSESEKLECDLCGKSLLPSEVCCVEKDAEDLLVCYGCFEDIFDCPCGCHGDNKKCVYRR